MLNTKKILTPTEQASLYKLQGGDLSETARQFSKKDIDYKTWDSESRHRFFNEVNDAEVKRHIRIAQAEIGDLHEKQAEELENMSTLFQTPKDQLEFLDKVAIKRNAEESLKTKISLGFVKDEFGNIVTDIEKARELDWSVQSPILGCARVLDEFPLGDRALEEKPDASTTLHFSLPPT